MESDAVYFVLRLDADPHARAAARAYADSIEKDNPQFAADIRRKLNEHGAGEALERSLSGPREVVL